MEHMLVAYVNVTRYRAELTQQENLTEKKKETLSLKGGNLQVPYDELSLRIALLGLNNKMEKDKEFADRLLSMLDSLEVVQITPALAAEYHGITPLDLANSPNRPQLMKTYEEHRVIDFISKLTSVGLDDREAWGMLAKGTGLL